MLQCRRDARFRRSGAPREVAPAEVDRYRDVRPAALPNEAFRVPTQRQLAGKARYSGIEILALTAEVTGIGTGHLRSSRRTPPVVKARQIAMWAMYRHCGFGLPEVGRKLGGKDHTTVLHATRKIAALAAHLGISLDDEPGEVVASLWSAEWPTINVKALRAAR